MKVYKLTIMIIDHDEIGIDQGVEAIENARYPNHCINPVVVDKEEREIGEWDDDHPLNSDGSEGYFTELFK